MTNTYTENLRGFQIKFKTKSGIFSPHGIDDGTRLLINQIAVEDKSLVADLGSGTGIIAFVLARLNPKARIHLLDDHLRSVELAKQNASLNNLSNIEIYLSDLFSAVKDRTYHQILSNPPQQLGNEFLEELIDESYRHLKPAGSLWIVVKNNLLPVIERTMRNKFQNVKIVSRSREHVVLKGEKNG